MDSLGNYLSVNKWRLNFLPFLEEISSTLVRVRLPKLPLEFFNKGLLLRVGNCLGKAICINDTTRTATGWRFARLSMEIDLENY